MASLPYLPHTGVMPQTPLAGQERILSNCGADFHVSQGTPLPEEVEEGFRTLGLQFPEHVLAGRPRHWQKHYRYRVDHAPPETQLNPLLRTSSINSSAPPLEWNMLLHPMDATLARNHESAQEFMHSPATQPPVKELILVIPDRINGAYTTVVQNSRGISMYEVLFNVFETLMAVVYQHEPQWANLDKSGRRRVCRAYSRNRSLVNNNLGLGLRRIDFLGERVIFGGLHRDFRAANLVHRHFSGGKSDMPGEVFVVDLHSTKHNRDSWFHFLLQ